jgi:hypothetical protein
MSGRLRAMRIIAGFMAVAAIGFGTFTIVFGIVSPEQEPHAFHNPIVASLLMIVSAPAVIAIARSPDRAIRSLVILAAIGVAAVASMAVSLTIDPFTMPFVLLSGVLWALAPDRSNALPPGRVSVLLLAASAPVAVLLVPYALDQATLQRTDHSSEHAAFFHWVEMSFYATAIPLLGVLGAVRPFAYRLAGWCAGLSLMVMGGASLLFNGYASALPSGLALAALAGGAALVALLEFEARR